MSDIGLIVILAVLILGGLIATIGDRIGSKVGKARLSLFNLRPKQTATIVTILTGTLISASTFGVLFGLSSQFRAMLFDFDRIRDELRDRTRQLQQTVTDLDKTNQQKSKVEDELARTRAERQQAESQLKRINNSLKESLEKQRQTNAQLQRAEAQRDLIRGQLTAVSSQAEELRSEINQLQAERASLIAQRDQVRAQIAQRDEEIAERTQLIEQRDREIADRDQVIAQREVKLREIQEQQALLEQAAQQSEQEARLIRDGFLAILRNQVLSAAVFRVLDPKDARAAIDELLRQANRVALQAVRPGSQENVQIVAITNEEVERLIRQTSDGRPYVVRIQSNANYVRGERRPVMVTAFVAPNQLIFNPGDVIVASTLEPARLPDNEFRQRVNQLIAFSNLRARRAGVLNDDTVQLPEPRSYAAFLEQLRQYQTPVELRVVAADVTYTSGPLKIELVAVQNGQVVLKTAFRLPDKG